MEINALDKFVGDRVHANEWLRTQLVEVQDKLETTKAHINNLIEARRIISAVSQATQTQFKSYVESLVTTAIQSVFPTEGYKFIVDYVMKSNRAEINLLVQQGDKDPYVPEDEQGGALLDIISFALRVTLWMLESPKSRNTIVMDEPFKWSGALTGLAGQMMKEISHKLNLQIIMVTHSAELKDIADRIWEVKRVNGGESYLVGDSIKQPVKINRRKTELLQKSVL